MNFVQLLLLGAQIIGDLALNPIFGLNEDGARVAALFGVLAKIGARGPAATPELESFTNEIKALRDSGEAVDTAVWDALTAQRHADADAIEAARPK